MTIWIIFNNHLIIWPFLTGALSRLELLSAFGFAQSCLCANFLAGGGGEVFYFLGAGEFIFSLWHHFHSILFLVLFVLGGVHGFSFNACSHFIGVFFRHRD